MLDQEHYAESIIELYGMGNCKPVSPPLVPAKYLWSAMPEELEKFKELEVNFRSALGCINYLSTTPRADISHSISILSQFLEKPGISHGKSFLHITKYLKGTQSVGLVYCHGNYEGLKAYSDAD
ncbi:hypothetical protein O181_059111 [Austropuccinia psidii MF-1]|uniref:Reverse transcriptase Ty1/copia-type domain-containing protein n=1 Tax=Austropuccinia psidii MF-1 TaxID=1389203 RepID=A0A9Q3EID0_9BASI|nr:hypothetical protein [Austropuccinia psidii MF-1]